MTNGTLTRFPLLVLAVGLAGCKGARTPGPSAPSPGHPRSAPEFLREHVPGNAAAEDKQNAGKTRAIRDARPPTIRSRRWNG